MFTNDIEYKVFPIHGTCERLALCVEKYRAGQHGVVLCTCPAAHEAENKITTEDLL